ARALEQLTLLQEQISKREELMYTLREEIDQTDRAIARSNEVITSLGEDIEQLETEYAQLIRAAYRARLQNSWLTFLLSSRSFNEAFRRWQYLRQYQRFRSRQARLIVDTQEMLQRKLVQLNGRRQAKEALLQVEENQQLAITREKSAQDQLLSRLKSNESKILADIRKQEAAKAELNRAIEKAIAAEIARVKAEEESSARSNKRTSSASRSGSFARRRGDLPWPVTGDIVKRFGRQPHPTVKGVEISNNGIDIEVDGSTTVQCVADGTVVSTHFVPGYRNMVIVRHDEYYTVYSNLEGVSVNSKMDVSVGQVIGRISDEAGTLHFEIWKQKERLNPERWIHQ
ncbi:MAG: peptidoglycan DD-metalloendopeptidase family protein, partial [Bacteroidota bacterium]